MDESPSLLLYIIEGWSPGRYSPTHSVYPIQVNCLVLDKKACLGQSTQEAERALPQLVDLLEQKRTWTVQQAEP